MSNRAVTSTSGSIRLYEEEITMGLLDVLLGRHRNRKCPRCGEPISLELEACPKCGGKIEDMFRIECPKCKEQAPMKARHCAKCGTQFYEEQHTFVCPRCRYKSKSFLTRCPACGQKFM